MLHSALKPTLLAAGLLLTLPALAALEGKLYVVTDWKASHCPEDDRPSWDDMLDGWYDHMNDYGAVFKDGRLSNGNLNSSYFCDYDTNTACDDAPRIDDADVAMLGTHGIDRGQHWAGVPRELGPLNSCMIEAPIAGATGARMHVGDYDLEYLHLSSCESMNDEHWSSTWRMFFDGDSAGSGNRLRIATGFHGLMWIGESFTDDYATFALNAHVQIASGWLDALYDDDVEDEEGRSYEQCPVAMAIGRTQSGCEERLTKAGYITDTFGDPGNPNHVCTMYFDGCDPKAETALNP